MSQAEWWNTLGRFWERSTGGADVAARPDTASNVSGWPSAPRAAGVSEACDWLVEGFTKSELPRLLLLVGGPGAGKSHAAAQVVQGLEALDSPNALAQRTYSFGAGDRNLTLVNDATISSDVFPVSPLRNEIDAAVAAGDHLLACVNRGVIVEELAQMRTAGEPVTDLPGGRVIQWIYSGDSDVPAASSKIGWGIENVADESYVRAGCLYSGDDPIADVVVIFVDVNSLLEAAPTVTFGDVDIRDLAIEHYRVLPFESRRLQECAFTPAGALFGEVVQSMVLPLEKDPGVLFDPFLANLQAMEVEPVRRGVLSVLRAAEIVSGQRMTYREIWGALSRFLIGGVYMECESNGLRAHVLSLQPTPSDDAIEQFDKLRRLAEFRYSQAIFGSGKDATEVERDPLLRLVHLVDPVRDAIPGRIESGGGMGWASSVADAFSGDAGSSSPLQGLIASSDASNPFLLAVSSFDKGLDDAFVAALSEKKSRLSERQRQDMNAWYGAYLTRMFAVSNGIPAFRREVAAWTVAWDMHPNIPHSLEEQLTTLLKPLRYPAKGGGVPLFPVYESRTNPIQGDQVHSRIGIRSKDVQVRSSVDADSLFVAVTESGRDEVSMLLDFAMIREAMACASGFAGATELSEATSPRLERFRAARLVAGKKMDTLNYRIILASKDKPLSVDVAS